MRLRSLNPATASKSQLLAARFCDLEPLTDFRPDASRWLGPAIQKLFSELKQAGFKHFQPLVYFGDEWFSPQGSMAIAVPFYLAHPRLKNLEREMTGTVEGGTAGSCLKLLRHEAGHAFDHAFALSGTEEYRQIFGAPPKHYRPSLYLPNRQSREFVRHLPGHYAQSHPDEDFAETFAVVIDRSSRWQSRYATWPVAYQKCSFVQDLIRRHSAKRPRRSAKPEDTYNACRMRKTLSTHYSSRLENMRRANAVVRKMTAKASLSSRSQTN